MRLSPRAGFVLAATIFISLMAAAAAPSPLYPVYQSRWGFSSFTLTLIFAVYVFALLAALLTAGSISDHIGRRPVIAIGLLLLCASMLIFIFAGAPVDLMAARVVQGLATGFITATVTATIVDLQPSAFAGSIVTSSSPTTGIAIGAVLAGALVQYAPWPRFLVYWVLLAIYLLMLALLALAPEPVGSPRPHRSIILRALRPSVGVAVPARTVFVAMIPALCATWALGGLYLSLGSSAVAEVFGIRNHFVAGLILGAFFLAGAIGSVIAMRLPAGLQRVFSYTALASGVILSVVATLTSTIALYVAGSVVAGLGFGATFLMAMSAIAAVTPSAERGQTFATTFVVSYSAFSVPAVAAGLAAQQWGLRGTLVGYGVLDVSLVVLATLMALRTRSTTADEPAASNGPCVDVGSYPVPSE